MEEPELVYCEVENTEKNVELSRPPLPQRRHNISASFIEVDNSLRRIPPPRLITVTTNVCQRCRQSSTSRSQVVLTIAVVIFAILSGVFMTLYFTTATKNEIGESQRKACVHQNCVIVSSCNESDNTNDNTVKKKKAARSCADLYKKEMKADGVYSIDPDGLGAFNVSCDMETNGGGWTVFQRRMDGSVDFYRRWNDYKEGFGDLRGEFWLGLDKINRLTRSTRNVLRVDLEDFQKNKSYAKYSRFLVASEIHVYTLVIGGYSGPAGDSFGAHNGMAFTTKDVDLDQLKNNNCAVKWRSAWWYNKCRYRCNLNGQYFPKKDYEGVIWEYGEKVESLKKTEMKLRPDQF